jgi:predicted MPP superfamily phosphohydrolase
VTESIPFSDLVLWGALANVVVGLITLAVVRQFTEDRPNTFSLVAVGAVTGVAAIVQVAMVSDGFGKLHVLYLWVFVTLPILGAVVLLAGLVPALRPTRWGMVGAGGLVALGAVGFYGTHVEPRWIRTERVSLDVDGVDGEPVRIGVLSDVQTADITDYEWGAVRRLMREEPDVILVAGDYFQSPEAPFLESLPELRELLGTLEAPGGVFLVEGDVDSPERMAMITEGQDLDWLDHEVATTEVRGTTIAVGGIPPSWASPESRATIAELAGTDGVDVRILLSHRPDAAYEVPEGEVDLVVAGHTHGGQVRLPFVGPPITMSGVPRSVAGGGLHEIEGVPIYLSNGVGMERHSAPQVRLGDRPSVGVVTLT